MSCNVRSFLLHTGYVYTSYCTASLFSNVLIQPLGHEDISYRGKIIEGCSDDWNSTFASMVSLGKCSNDLRKYFPENF